jgi:hypothetical protein
MAFPEICYLKILKGVSGDRYLLSAGTDSDFEAFFLASTDDGSGRQRWKLVPVAGGPSDTFNILGVGRDGGPVYITWADNMVMFADVEDGTDGPRWQFIPTEDSSFLIKAVPVPGVSSVDHPYMSCSADGTRVDMYSQDDGSGRQRWYVTADTGRVPPPRPRLTAANIPAETKAGFFITLPTSDFQARLQQGGSLQLSGEDLDLGDSDPDKGDLVFMALDALELDHARIITGGKQVVIFVNRLTSQAGSIISYTDSQHKAARGADGSGTGQSGQAGAAGGGGGSVSIYVSESFDGSLRVDLRGQDGGDGGNGTVGANGSPGSNGQAAVGFLGLTPAGNGGDGSPGQHGGNGGNGGGGGGGGVLKLVNVGASPISDTSLSFSATGGQGGLGGQPAAGGIGGPGGSGGAGYSGSNFTLSPGSPGAQGPNGAAGTAGLAGAPGSDGQATRNNVDFETLARLASPYVAGHQS